MTSKRIAPPWEDAAAVLAWAEAELCEQLNTPSGIEPDPAMIVAEWERLTHEAIRAVAGGHRAALSDLIALAKALGALDVVLATLSAPLPPPAIGRKKRAQDGNDKIRNAACWADSIRAILRRQYGAKKGIAERATDAAMLLFEGESDGVRHHYRTQIEDLLKREKTRLK
jgi:hypothetical protein